MKEINNFFDDRYAVHHLSNKDLEQLNSYIAMADAFARLSYKSVYVIDYHTGGFEYVSDNPLFLCGLTSQEVKELGYAFYFRNVKKEDLELLIKIHKTKHSFYDAVPIEERK